MCVLTELSGVNDWVRVTLCQWFHAFIDSDTHLARCTPGQRAGERETIVYTSAQ